jgi:hypothetical protein
MKKDETAYIEFPTPCTTVKFTLSDEITAVLGVGEKVTHEFGIM